MATSNEIVFRVTGAAQTTVRGVRVAVSASRAAGDQHTLRARPGEDVMALTIANGPTLVLHPANAAMLLQSQSGAAGRGGTPVPPADGAVQVDAQLAFAGPAGEAGTSRGFVSRVVLEAVELVAGPVREQAARLTARVAADKLESATSPGVHRLPPPGPDGLPSFKGKDPVKIPASTEPILVFLHGTFSSLSGSFADLWRRHPVLVKSLFDFYGGGVYGLDHKSVTETPFANARRVLEALPDHARVHLVTYSRGGLVGETLVRAAREGGGPAFDATDLALLKGAPYSRHRGEIEALNQLIAARKPRFERMVRVASPARGTLLASGRLDAYLGAIQWGLEKAGLPVLPELIDFTTQVARERTDPTVFPGLEAMIPGRPVMQVLTRPDIRLASELRVVAGDIQGDSVLSWLKVLLTDAYYLTDHDLVVNTNSMYGGTPRVQRPTFVFERGAEVSHFRYFTNDSSARAIVEGLTSSAPTQFRAVGPLSWDGRASDGLRALRPQIANTGQRPAVFVLPGIMGSHLMVDGKRVWAAPLALFFGGLKKLRYPDAKVVAEEPMDRYFGDLMAELSDTYDVIPFAYDWRRPIEGIAEDLAAEVDKALAARAGKGLPVRILAHSMGGLVVRAMELLPGDVWNRFMAQEGARIVLAGTPNRGAYAPMLALSAMHPLVNTVDALDVCTSWKELKGMLGNFPGLMQLQALRAGDGADLTQRTQWQALADFHAAAPTPPQSWHDGMSPPDRAPWGVPTQDALDALRGLRAALDARLDTYQRYGNRIALVAGCAEQTIVDVRKGEFGVEYVAASAGDGTVPWDSLRLPGVAIWRAQAEHGDLLRERSVFRAYRDLLDNGTTSALPVLSANATRGGAGVDVPAAPATRVWVPVRSPYPPTLGEVQAAALGSGLQPPPAAAADEGPHLPLSVEVVHGDLKHVRDALLLGHYRSETLSGAERTLDNWLGGTLQRALNLGLYPTQHGEQQVFVNCRGGDNPFAPAIRKPEAVIIAGLADEDELTPQRLEDAAGKAAMAWSQFRAQQGGAVPVTLSMASVLVGSGGWRIDVAQSAVAIARGLWKANERLFEEKLPVVSNLTLVELYGDRASMAHTALASVARQERVPMRLVPHVARGAGGRQRPVERGYRGAPYDLVYVTSEGDAHDELRFTLHTGRARSELRARSTQRRLVDRMVASAESEQRHDADLARALFNMLVPLELRPVLAGSSSLFLSLDPASARIPWEILQGRAHVGDPRPFAVRVKMVRTLRLENFRNDPVDNRHLRNVLVIGEPACDEGYPPLPAARLEAVAVRELLQERWVVRLLDERPNARQVMQALNESDWRIVHIAGHGAYEKVPSGPDGTRYGGVVLDGGTFLGPKELAGLDTVPELVFVNCCYLGKIDDALPADKRPVLPPRGEFASTVAEQLMRIGVRCVVAAGWAVDDVAARAFATAFYAALLERRSFADAVLAARQAAYALDPGGNTWAAYQCYGDPGWSLRTQQRSDEARQRPGGALTYRPATPTRADLYAALDEVGWEAKTSHLSAEARAQLVARLRDFEQQEGTVWGEQGRVAEAFATAWADLGELKQAIVWYERAVAADDSSATLRAHELLVNLRVRLAVDESDARTVRRALRDLDRFIQMHASTERLSLRGSAHKRLALLTARRASVSRTALAGHLDDMAQAYVEAATLAGTQDRRTEFYPRMQAACGLLLVRLLAGRPTKDERVGAALIDACVALLESDRAQPDFWSTVGQGEWELYRSLALGRLHKPYSDIAGIWADAHVREPGVKPWSSVRDTVEIVARVARLSHGMASQADAADRLLAQVRGYCVAAS